MNDTSDKTAPTFARGAHRIVVIGGGFGGIFTAKHLEKQFAGRENVEIVLISLDNYFLMTPLLFEACSGVLALNHCSLPVREFLQRARFVEAMVTGIDLEARTVTAEVIEGEPEEFVYDQLVLALGSMTNDRMIPGSKSAFTFKTLADAIVLRNHLIERFERADVERDPARKAAMLTCVIVGGGLVGVELLGELTAFVDKILTYYPNIRREEVRFFLFQHGERILPEIDPSLAEYAHRVLADRPGVEICVRSGVKEIKRGGVEADGRKVDAETIVLCAGIQPNPLITSLALEKDKRGKVLVEPTMRALNRPEVWALGDCASIPGPDGEPYPTLAQHALREAKLLARNIRSALDGEPVRPFIFQALGSMASLGRHDGIGRVLGIPLRGFAAWWVRRTYYLMQMPDWSRRLRIMIDWTVALFFRPDIVKLDMAREATVYLSKSGAVRELDGTLVCLGESKVVVPPERLVAGHAPAPHH